MPDVMSAEILLRERGLRVTPQRQSVLRLFLENAGQHWSADQVREKLLPNMPGLARGTTYKVLDELVRGNICEELPTPQGTAIYGLRLAPHHHFVCRACHRWFDVGVEGLDQLAMVGGPPDAVVDEVAVTFLGTCGDCG